MYEYLASVQSAVRRINERLQTLSGKFGANSSMLWEYKAKIDVLLPENYRYKNGVVQISMPSDIYGDQEKMDALEEIENTVQTWQQYKEQYQTAYDKYKSETEFFDTKHADMPEFITTMENVHNALASADSEQLPSDALEILKVKDRRNTYAELQQVSEILRSEGWL